MNGSSSTLHRPVPGRRRWTWLFRANPLRRRTDKIQAAVLAACTLVAAAAVPLITVLALHVQRSTVDDVRATQQNSTQTTATTTGPGQSPLGSSGPVSPTLAAPARWTTPTGDLRTGFIQVPADTPPGTDRQITIAGDGHYVSKASAQTSTVVVPIIFGMTLFAVTLLVCFLTYNIISTVLERQRATALTNEWAELSRTSSL
ncbi:Rv1733c family protein [Kribbella sp. WER1]